MKEGDARRVPLFLFHEWSFEIGGSSRGKSRALGVSERAGFRGHAGAVVPPGLAAPP